MSTGTGIQEIYLITLRHECSISLHSSGQPEKQKPPHPFLGEGLQGALAIAIPPAGCPSNAPGAVCNAFAPGNNRPPLDPQDINYTDVHAGVQMNQLGPGILQKLIARNQVPGHANAALVANAQAARSDCQRLVFENCEHREFKVSFVSRLFAAINGHACHSFNNIHNQYICSGEFTAWRNHNERKTSI